MSAENRNLKIHFLLLLCQTGHRLEVAGAAPSSHVSDSCHYAPSCLFPGLSRLCRRHREAGCSQLQGRHASRLRPWHSLPRRHAIVPLWSPTQDAIVTSGLSHSLMPSASQQTITCSCESRQREHSQAREGSVQSRTEPCSLGRRSLTLTHIHLRKH